MALTTVKAGGAAFALAALLSSVAVVAQAQSVLRLEEVPVGELDPAKATDSADAILIYNAYDALVLAAQGGPGVQPHLAKSWEIEGNVFTFALRDDVKHASGNPLTAEDVVYSLERTQALGAGFSYLFAIVESVEALDAHTVRFTLSAPYAPFVSSLMRLPIIDSVTAKANTVGEDWAQAYLSAQSAGSGAYVTTAHDPQSETVFAKNPAYFLPIDAAAPEVVRLRYGLEASTVRTMMARGEHDITSQWLPPEVMQSIAKEPGTHFLQETGGGGFYVKLNTQKAPLDDVHCRRALSYAFDYTTALAITKITDEVAAGAPSTGAIPVGMFGAKPLSEGAMAQDMARAKEELALCKYNPAEHRLEISWVAEVPIEERFALLMQATYSQLGFQSDIVRVPWVLLTEQVTKPETTPHIVQMYQNANTGDTDALLYSMYHSSRAGTWQSTEYLNDPEVDALLDAGRLESDPEKRQALYADLNAKLIELAPTIYAFDRNVVLAASGRVQVPALQDRAQQFSIESMGYTFRLMSVTE